MSVLKLEDEGVWEKTVQSKGVLCTEMGEDFCTNFTHTFLESVGRRSYNAGNLQLISGPSLKRTIFITGDGSYHVGQ